MEKFDFNIVPDNAHVISSHGMLVDIVELCFESMDTGIEYYISLDTEIVYKHVKNTDYAVVVKPCKDGSYRLNDYGSVYRHYTKERLLETAQQNFDADCENN